MPIITQAGNVDIRILTVKLNNDTPIHLHYVVRRNPYTAGVQYLFVLREIDMALLRAPDSNFNLLASNARSEQCIRTVVNLVCKGDHVWATNTELKVMKAIGMFYSHLFNPSLSTITG